MKLTKPQKRALVGLAMLKNNQGDHFYNRREISQVSRHTYQGYPTKTLVKLAGFGMAETDSIEILAAVVNGRCRCGCDRWRITISGLSVVSKLKVLFAGKPKVG